MRGCVELSRRSWALPPTAERSRRGHGGVGMSERTLARLLTHATGMSFGRWRQQLHLMLAVRWLAAGASVRQVADMKAPAAS